MLIGIMGRKRSGKDTVAGILAEEHGFTHRAFADKVREVLLGVNPAVWANEEQDYVSLAYYVGMYGWEDAKAKTNVRVYMQRLGVAVRESLGETVWLDQVVRADESGRDVVISDVRFHNEAHAVREAGGWLWRIERESAPDDPHISEQEWRDVAPDVVLWNAGDMQDLRMRVRFSYELTKLRRDHRP